ncbi:hypothetical protein EJ08DRAFT_694216 [Tothia fuscella]|uniref:Chitin-binding type-1 domain-containing protein n=1 Tax=Tothia fuscella TaxID=1048955 RepID=A0A9P4U1Q2_9PEZI|nr:hypothetical protein EJ08DRAFT_694216 [Tothia fuscella]
MTSSTLPVQSITPSSTRQSSTGAAPTCTNVATPIACPANNGSYYNDAKIECSIGYAQFNVAGTGATAATIELCIDRCRNTTTCTAGVWQPGPKNCYLKTAVGTRSVNDANIAFYFPGGVTTGGQCAAAGSATSVPPIYSSSTMSSSAVVRPASSGSMLSSSSRMSSSTPPSPSPSSRVTPDGTCGGLNGYTCTGSQGGIQPCCSASGFCGIGPLYCGVGCQSLFGICDTISSSSSRVSSSSAPPVSSSASVSLNPSISTTSVSSSRTSSSIIPTPSSKRGLCYVPSNKFPNDDLIWVQPGSPLNWYYNYGYRPSARWVNDPRLQFVPMLFGDFTNNFTATVIQQLQAGINVSHVFSYNEPDGSFNEGGSQVTPARAAARWLQDIEPLRAYGVSLGAPAVTGSQRGFQWLQQFFTACNGQCHADFVPIHWYGSFIGLASEVGQMRATYPNMTIWVTEFADSHQDLARTQMTFNQSVTYLDRLSYVVRHSYFGAFRSDVSNVGANATFLDSCGRLTDIGAGYLDLPDQIDGNLPSSGTCTLTTTTSTTSIVTPISSSRPVSLTSSQASPTPSSSSRAPSAISSSVVPSSSSSVLPSSSSSVVPSSSSSPSPSPFPSPTSSSFSSSVTMPPSSSSSVAPSTCAPGTTLHIPQPATPMPQLSCLDQDQDETFGSAVLPLNLQIYSISSNRVFANTNGLLSLNQGTSQYEHKPLPADNFDSTVLGIVFPMWTDMKMSASPSGDGVFYFANTTYAIFEWINYASYSDTARYQFTAAWNAATPTAWTFRYYLSGFEDGTAATVGLQGGLRGPALQWIYEQPLAAPGTQVVCDTNLNTCVVTAFDPTAP